MLTNIDIDKTLISKIMKIREFKSQREIVDTALKEYYKLLVISELKNIKGRNSWEGDLDQMRTD